MTEPTDSGEAQETTNTADLNAVELLQKVARPVIQTIFAAIPIILSLVQKILKFSKQLPIAYLPLLIGFITCFFGGLYPAFFAAIEAAIHGGLEDVKKALVSLSEEVLIIMKENQKDNQIDSNGDGETDVNKLSNKELTQRKITLVLTKMNPAKVNDAIFSLYRVWISVISVLTVKFARTIAMGLVIGEFFTKLMNRTVAPIIKRATPVEYRKWVPVLVEWMSKGIGVSVAWTIQSVMSAFTSALAGGLIMSRAILFLIANEVDQEDTRIDEAASYLFAAVGFYFQCFVGFKTPFPLNILLWPIDIIEYYIRWTVMKE